MTARPMMLPQVRVGLGVLHYQCDVGARYVILKIYSQYDLGSC